MIRAVVTLVLVAGLVPQRGTPPTSRPSFFTSPYSFDQMKGKQAVVETSAGKFVIQLQPDVAPNHVGHFMKLARDGSYVDTIFHRVIRYGLIQGGDPLSKDPAKATQYGTGGLNEIKAEREFEILDILVKNGEPVEFGQPLFLIK